MSARASWIGLLTAALGVGWGVVGLYSLKTVAPVTPLELPAEEAVQMRRFLPQGWGFFTRNPREPWRTTYLRQGDRWVSPVQRQASFQQLGGARRGTRRLAVESAYLVEELWDGWAEDCDADPMTCLDALQAPAYEPEIVDNPFPHPVVCGEIAIVAQPPVPFAWREMSDVVMPSKVMKLRVVC